MKRHLIRLIATVTLLATAGQLTAAVPGIHLMDPNLKAELIDTDAKEFFVSHTMDLSGQLFVGTREALFVYSRKADGGFGKKQELYRFPKDSWLYDVEVYGDDLFVLCNTALYRIRGARTQRTNLKPEKLLWGAPMGHYHQGLHGMEFGPEGDLYLSIGDPQPHLHWDRDRPDHLWHWTFYVGPKNTPVVYNGVGSVLRYRLADHNLTVHTSGLRNPCGISFDPNWNLFANDNDQEGGIASPCRLVYTPQHAWAGWVRGWADRHNPKRLDMLPVTNLKIDVPVGQCWYDDTVLGEKYKGSLFVANWGDKTVSQHKMSPNGAGFTAPNKPLLLGDGIRRPVSVMPTNDGRLIVAVCYMQGNEGSPVRQTDLLLISPKNKTFPLQDYSKKPLDQLLNAPWQVRYQAHREIMRTGNGMAEANKLFESANADHRAIGSLLHLAAQKGDAKSLAKVKTLATSNNPAQSTALRAAGKAVANFKDLPVSKLHGTSKDPRVLHALLEYIHATTAGPMAPVLKLATHQDAYVRQSAARFLAKTTKPTDAAKWQSSSDADSRLAAVMAAGFRIWDKAEATKAFPKKSFPALDKQMKHKYADGDLDLKSLGKPVGIFKLSEWWAEAPNSQANAADFNILKTALADSDVRVSTAAAVNLFFLKDSRVEADLQAILKREGINLRGIPEKVKMSNKDKRAAAKALANAKLSDETDIPAAFVGIDWNQKAASGDVAIGKKLFTSKGCIACHLAPDDGIGGSIGPSLVDSGKRFTPVYLVESILVPNRAVSPNFHPVTLTMKDGTLQVGYIESEGEGIIKLRGITGQLASVPVASIKKRESSHQSMMPAGLIQTPEEMADMVAFLSGGKPGASSDKGTVAKPDGAAKKGTAAKGQKKKPAKKRKKKGAGTAPAGQKTRVPASGQRLEPGFVSLFNGKDLTGWKQLNGTATYEVEDGAIVGTTAKGSPNSFLCTEKNYGDFVLRFEVKLDDDPLNSGVQIRSLSKPGYQDGVVHGYQVEIATNGNAGFIYDEARRRAWLSEDRSGDKKRSAFKKGEWNRFRVLCNGDLIRTWINGVQIAEVRDSVTAAGFIGLQVHSVKGDPNWKVRWRNITIKKLPVDKNQAATSTAPVAKPTANKSLPGWKTTGNWQPAGDSVIKLTPRDGESGWNRWSSYLWRDRKYADFECDFEYKHDKGGNSGFYFRVDDPDNPVKTGIEIQILDSHGKAAADMTHHDCGGVIQTAPPKVNAAKPAGQWNRMQVKCVGNHLTASLNGQAIVDLMLNETKLKTRPINGHVGIQDHGENFSIRNFSIREIKDETGFEALFNGKDLSDWDGKPGAWRVSDGEIQCTGVSEERNWLIWRGGEPSDFTLRLDFKYEKGNSGVQVRSDDLGDWQVFGYQVEIAPQAKMGLWHHSLLGKEDPAHGARFFMARAGEEVNITKDGKKSVKRVATAKETVAHFQQDGWNQMEIIAKGNTLTQKINGVVFSTVTDYDQRMSRAKGFIALQDHGKGCSVAFRDIRLKRVPTDK